MKVLLGLFPLISLYFFLLSMIFFSEFFGPDLAESQATHPSQLRLNNGPEFVFLNLAS